MTTARRLTNFLNLSQTNYRVVSHRPTETASETARAAHLASARIAKSVLLRDRHSGRYVIALAPACNRVELDWVRKGAAVDPVLAREAELGEVFPDCTLGAVPGFLVSGVIVGPSGLGVESREAQRGAGNVDKGGQPAQLRPAHADHGLQ